MAEKRHERSDVSLRAVLYFGLSLLVAAVVVHFVVERFYAALAVRYPPTIYGARQNPPTVSPPQPRLQANPTGDMERFYESELQRLSSYGWVNREAGIIHIPIERAIELTATQAAPAAASPTPTGSPSR